MKKNFRIPDDTLAAQALASDPSLSAWVSANAGSGKTHVLASRVIRLLLKGTDPSKILCLTYTRAAAANMANRVFENLASWSVLPDDALAEEVGKLEGRRPTPGKLRRARQLFARALETPGGLKIQTIHAFCEAILHQFPLEANIAGHFEMLDEQMEEALFAEARRDLLTSIAAERDGPLEEAFAEVLERGGESGLQALLAEIVAKRDDLRHFIDAVADEERPYAALMDEFGFAPEETAETIATAAWPVPGFGAAEFLHFVAAAQETDASRVLKGIVPAASEAFDETDPVLRLEVMARGFLKADGDVYGESTFKAALKDRLPGIYERYLQAAEFLRQACGRLALFRMLAATTAALQIADALIARYERLKRARGFLDFNDLIMRTVRLLGRSDVGPWVQYKLDRGIDHILIDEAQDTSPEQWRIVGHLADEFFAGKGARDRAERTIFAVGDEKQSIYSFQGAEPEAFARSGFAFQRRVPEAGGRFERVRLTRSFRSTEDVLRAVDLVFAREEARRGLTRDPEPVEHRAIRDSAPGYVEIWSPLSPEVVEEPDDWTQAVDHASAPAARLAEVIAEKIEGWLKSGEILEGKGRRLKPGDIMVLVRKRDRFVHALSRSLKNRRISVAGADRLRLTAHIAIKDLMALGRFLLQPDDDLSLAAVLKSPLFGLDEDALFHLAWPRAEHVSLFAALREKAGADEGLRTVLDALLDWQSDAAFKPAFEFYAGVLAGTAEREGARGRFVARLGHEANDILDEFLSFCLTAEKTGLIGLEALLDTLEGAAPEIKREMDQSRDEIRIMTVHAAKGLEAPVVFLVDPGSAPVSNSHLPCLMPFSMKELPIKGFVWRQGKDLANAVARGFEAEVREKAEEEYRRLLYVGMTRAEDRLIVCGYHGVRGPAPSTWHSLVRQAFLGEAGTEELDDPEICAPALRFRVTPLSETAMIEAADEEPEAFALPTELKEPLPPSPAMPRPLSPSRAGVFIEGGYEPAALTHSPVLEGAAGPAFALERGNAVHRLLQVLPELSPCEREAAARRYLARVGAAWPDEEVEKACGSVLSVLSDERFAPIFAPGSRAEVSVMGELLLGGTRRAVSGKVDRLAVADSEVLLVDYKTNRPAPEVLAEVPDAYVAQLALYAELLKPLYPGKRFSAALLFTEGPRLIALTDEAMAVSLARLTRA
ncbi:double-strand break repair helicase AddA [Chelativorans sp. AA-79]|uniref:double-strand break repair helicase AddA n=1 Tax=Chelativorans sp. AA-79 TaxID=3028735 RepID=UPI0023F8DCCB|nr:double-strand break repair helicase AddA [Chelativorans sp. AA-79]WEX09434.1 double-strand break repair helicase AddA [Chelativorans sp. AA-79]